jgi:hypothetical protein
MSLEIKYDSYRLRIERDGSAVLLITGTAAEAHKAIMIEPRRSSRLLDELCDTDLGCGGR